MGWRLAAAFVLRCLCTLHNGTHPVAAAAQHLNAQRRPPTPACRRRAPAKNTQKQNQIEAHPYWRNQALVDWATANGVHVTAYAPLGSPDSAAIVKRASDAPGPMRDAAVLRIAEKLGRSPAQVRLGEGGRGVQAQAAAPQLFAARAPPAACRCLANRPSPSCPPPPPPLLPPPPCSLSLSRARHATKRSSSAGPCSAARACCRSRCTPSASAPTSTFSRGSWPQRTSPR